MDGGRVSTTPLPFVAAATAPWAGPGALRTATAHHAMAILASGDPDAALPLLTAAVGTPGDEPGDTELLLLRAHAEECVGLPDSAIQDLLRAATTAHAPLPGAAGRLHELLDRATDGAWRSFLIDDWVAGDGIPDPDAELLRVHAAVLADDGDRARAALHRYVEATVDVDVADDERAAGEAASLLAKLRVDAAEDLRRLLMIAGLRGVLGDRNGALDDVQRVLDASYVADSDDDDRKLDGPAYELQAELLSGLSRPGEAIRAIAEAGSAWYWHDDYDRAAPLLRRAAARLPDDASIRWTLTDCLRILALRSAPPDKGLLLEAVAAWEEGRCVAVRTEIPSWAYRLRALLASNLADADAANRRSHLLMGSAALEDLVALDGGESNWVLLTHFYLSLAVYATARCTLTAATEAGEPGTEVLGEEARLAVAWDDSDVNTLVNQYVSDEKAEPDLAGWLLLFSGRPREAIDPLERAVADYPGDIESRGLLARALNLSGERERARSVFGEIRELWAELPDKSDMSYRCHVAESLYRAAEYGASVAHLEELIPGLANRPGLTTDLFGLLTLDLLAIGDIPRARETFQETLAHPLLLPLDAGVLADDLTELADTLRRDSARSAAAELAMLLAAEARSAIPKLRDRPFDLDAALAELRRELARPDPAGAVTVACPVAMARLLAERDARESGDAAFEALRAQPASPAAAKWLIEAADKLIRGGDALLASSRLAAAVECVPERDHELAGELLSRLALAEALSGETHAAEEALARSATEYALARSGATGDGIDRAAAIWCQDLGEPQQYWRLRNAIGAGHRGQVATLADRCLADLLSLDEPEGGDDNWPFTTPIAVEIDDTLVPEDPSPDGPMLGTYIPQMRARIAASLTGPPPEDGTSWLPGVRVRVGEGLGPGGFRIILYAIPRCESAVPEGMALCLAAADEIVGAVTDADHLTTVATIDPVTRRAAAWVPSARADQVAAAGVEVWRDPLVFVFRELEHQLRRHFDEYLSLDEVATLRERWESAFCDEEPPDVTLERLTAVVRALAREQVPLNDGGALLLASAGPVSVDTAVDQYRQAIVPSLPGSEEGTIHVRVPPKLAALASDPADAGLPLAGTLFDALAELRDALAELPEHVALITADPAARRAVRAYSGVEFPDIPVLCEQEVSGSSAAAREPAPAITKVDAHE